MTAHKLGRPFSENPRNVRLEIRLTQEEAQELQLCAERLGVTRTEVVIRGIKFVKDSLEK